MRFSFLKLIIGIFSICSFSAFAQIPPANSPINGPQEDGSIEEQFDFLMTKSNNYQDKKIVKRDKLLQLKNNVLDSMALINKTLIDIEQKLQEQKTTVNTLNGQLEVLRKDLDQTNEDKDSISFLGANMGKGGYKTLMWTIIAGLLGLLGFFIFRFRDSNAVTESTRKDLIDLQDEFENHRKRSLEREQLAMRRLQDELNRKNGGALPTK